MLLLWPWSTHGRVLSSEEGENLVGSTCTHPHHHSLDKEGWACELRNQGRLHVMGKGTFWKDDLGAFIRKRGSREAGQVKQFHHIYILSGITSLSPGETHLICHLPIFGLHDRSKAVLKVLKVSAEGADQLRCRTTGSRPWQSREESVSVYGKSKCKGPEAEKSLMSLINYKSRAIAAKWRSC